MPRRVGYSTRVTDSDPCGASDGHAPAEPLAQIVQQVVALIGVGARLIWLRHR
jgi:hypothetical protein